MGLIIFSIYLTIVNNYIFADLAYRYPKMPYAVCYWGVWVILSVKKILTIIGYILINVFFYKTVNLLFLIFNIFFNFFSHPNGVFIYMYMHFTPVVSQLPIVLFIPFFLIFFFNPLLNFFKSSSMVFFKLINRVFKFILSGVFLLTLMVYFLFRFIFYCIYRFKG